MHSASSIEITKSTHAGRCYGAMNLCAHGATVSGTKALGGWNKSDLFRTCYDRAFPVDALLGADSFNMWKPEEYFLAQDELGKSDPLQLPTFSDLASSTDPPTDIASYLFPWVEDELAALEVHMVQSRHNWDITLKQFLKLLQWLRIVLVQDCALLHAQHPHCPIFSFAPFTFPSFTNFSTNAATMFTAAKEKA